MATYPTSKSAPLSNAAKNDALGSDGDFTFTISDLLENDAGGARANTFFIGSGKDQPDQATYMELHGIRNNGDGKYTATSDFTYSVQIGNKGTWSTADVDVAHLSGKELLNNWNFEQDVIFPDENGSFNLAAIATTPTGWHNLATTEAELGHAGYNGGILQGFGEEETNWLDTATSPGNTHLSQAADLADGHTAHLSVSVAAQSLLFGNGDGHGQGQYVVPNDAYLEFKFGNDVLRIDLDDFRNSDDGPIDYNHFHTFEMDVHGTANVESLEIVAHNQDSAYSGFAIDHVSLQEWII